MSTTDKVAVTYRLSPNVVAALREAANRDRRSINAQVEVALRGWLAAWLEARLAKHDAAQGERPAS